MADSPPAAFRLIQQQAACVFASRARIEAALPFHGTDARAAGFAAAAALADFSARVNTEELDGLLIELTHPCHGLTLDALAETTREVVGGLLAASGGQDIGELSNPGTEHWWLTLCETRWFVLAFAPCYPADSPRHAFGSHSTFLLLQPVASFDQHATPRGAVIADEVRQMIRRAYDANGCPYDADLAQQDIEALKFVWPLHLGAAPVLWWQSNT
ncbi:hypothetical protein [Kitasatospora sp. GAS1066B]|uniref:hypothetical protein n=1 Tax=Kitasatospora sp. GAS1066B TaxID=3156271 RepID=UPI0035198EF1